MLSSLVHIYIANWGLLLISFYRGISRNRAEHFLEPRMPASIRKPAVPNNVLLRFMKRSLASDYSKEATVIDFSLPSSTVEIRHAQSKRAPIQEIFHVLDLDHVGILHLCHSIFGKGLQWGFCCLQMVTPISLWWRNEKGWCYYRPRGHYSRQSKY